jgi:twitching motility protein PilT
MHPVASLVSGAETPHVSVNAAASPPEPKFLFRAAVAAESNDCAIARLHGLLAEGKRRGASDVHITGGVATYCRIDNDLLPLSEVLAPSDVEQLALALLTPTQLRVFEQQKQIDLAFFTPDNTRYRANVYRQRGSVALAIRRLDEQFRTLQELNLPPQLAELADFPFGLVVVTGATGSGKSTTLATILHQINLQRASHVITIEDPIEHVHDNRRSLFHQRELHVDVSDFATALKAALREDPDVLLVGEMRDLETMRAAITAAETGHLVFSTLHTGDCVGSIGRMVGAFPADEQPMVRDQLSRVLRAVVSQRLLRHKSGRGRVPAVEIMRVSPAISNLIRLGDMRQAINMIQAGSDEGMLLLEQSLACLAAANLIDIDEARIWARDASVLESRFKSLTQRGWGR